MGTSKLIQAVQNNKTRVETFSKNGKYGFKIYREIAVSELDYSSKELAEIIGEEISSDLRTGNLKDVSD